MRTREERKTQKRDLMRKLRIEQPLRVLNTRLKCIYGITLDEYECMLVAQGGVCAICRRSETKLAPNGNPTRLAIDHDHATGTVRGLLCNRCNITIGRANDDAAMLRLAAEYLEKHTRRVRA